MIAWMNRHAVTTWAVAWGITGIGLLMADVFSHPRRGPLWAGVVFGAVSWSLAGAATLQRSSVASGLVVWAGAYLVALWLAAQWGGWLEYHAVGTLASAGVVGALLGWAAGAALGALISGCLVAVRPLSIRPAAFSLAWGLSFLLGGYVGVIAAYAGVAAGDLTAQATGALLAPSVGPRALSSLGWGLGAALGGAVASALGLAARRATLDPR